MGGRIKSLLENFKYTTKIKTAACAWGGRIYGRHGQRKEGQRGMRMEIILDIDTRKASLDEREIKEDPEGFAEWILGRAGRTGIEVKKAECVGGEESRDWRRNFEDRFLRKE